MCTRHVRLGLLPQRCRMTCTGSRVDAGRISFSAVPDELLRATDVGQGAGGKTSRRQRQGRLDPAIDASHQRDGRQADGVALWRVLHLVTGSWPSALPPAAPHSRPLLRFIAALPVRKRCLFVKEDNEPRHPQLHPRSLGRGWSALFDDRMLNVVLVLLLFLLVTATLGPALTERFAPRLAKKR